MKPELEDIRQGLKKSLSELTKFCEEHQAELAKLKCKDGQWSDPASIILNYFAARAGDNLILQIDKVLEVLPKERRKRRIKNK